MSCNLYSFSDSTKKTGMFYSSGTERFYTPETVNTPLTTATGVADIEGCKIRCKNTAGCQLFSYDQASQTCTMMGKTAGTKDTWTGVNNSLCSQTGLRCSKIPGFGGKFMNYHDYSDRIIVNDRFIDINGFIYNYISVEIENNRNIFIIITPVDIYVCENYTQRKTLLSLYSGDLYVILSYYFVNRTLVAPITTTGENITVESVDEMCNSVRRTSTTEYNWYHCYMFNSPEFCYYTIVKKDQITMIHNAELQNVDYRDPNKPGDFNPLTTQSFEIMNGIDLSFNDLKSARYSINVDSETMSIGTHGRPFTAAFTEKIQIPLTRVPRVGVNDLNNAFSIVFSFLEGSDRWGWLPTRSSYLDKYDLNTPYLMFNHPTKGNMYFRVILPFYYVQQGGYTVTYLPVIDVMPVDREGRMIVSTSNPGWKDYNRTLNDYFNETNNYSIHTGTFESLVDNTPLINNTKIESNCTVGPFFLYESQLLSGVPGFNRCSTSITFLISGSEAEDYKEYTDIYAAADDCRLSLGAEGFEWNESTKKARFIQFVDFWWSSTNYTDIIKDNYGAIHSDGVDVRTHQVTRDTDVGETRITNNYGYLIHNIFPTKCFSPMNDDSITYNNDNVNSRPFIGNYRNNPTIDKYDYGKPPTFRTMTTTSPDNVMVFVSSKIPVLGKQFYRCSPLIHRLPYKYTLLDSDVKYMKSSIVVDTITIENITYRNLELYVYKLESEYKNNTYLLTTINGEMIDFNLNKTGIMSRECMWTIVIFPRDTRKLFLFSVINNNSLQLNINSPFVEPSIGSYNLNLTLSTDFTCSLDMYQTTITNLNYVYVGNHLMVYKKSCNNGPEFLRTFRFLWDGRLVDESSGKILTAVGFSNQAGKVEIPRECNPYYINFEVYENYCNESRAVAQYYGDSDRYLMAQGCPCSGSNDNPDPDSSAPIECSELYRDDRTFPPPYDTSLCNYYRGSAHVNNYHRGSFILFSFNYSYVNRPPTAKEVFSSPRAFFRTLWIYVFAPPVLVGNMDPADNALYFAALVLPGLHAFKGLKWINRIKLKKIPDTPIDIPGAPPPSRADNLDIIDDPFVPISPYPVRGSNIKPPGTLIDLPELPPPIQSIPGTLGNRSGLKRPGNGSDLSTSKRLKRSPPDQPPPGQPSKQTDPRPDDPPDEKNAKNINNNRNEENPTGFEMPMLDPAEQNKSHWPSVLVAKASVRTLAKMFDKGRLFRKQISN